MKRKWLPILAAVAGLAMMATGAIAQTKKVVLNFGLSYVPIGNSPVFTVPKSMGFWEEEGLDVEVQFANGSGPALQQLIARQVTATISGFPPALSLIEQGAPVKIIGSYNSRNIYYPVALESSAIRSIEDMRGAKIGVLSAASSNVYWIKGLLAEHGIDPDNEVEIIAVGAGPAALQALASGRIDVLQLFEASYDQIEQAGYPLRRFTEDPDFNRLAFTFGIVAHEDGIANNRETLEGLMRGITKGVIYARANPEEVVKMHWAAHPATKPQGVSDEEAMQLDLQVLQGALNNHQWAYEGRFGYAAPEEVEAVLATLHQFGAIETSLTSEQVYDTSFLDAANDFDHQEVAARQPPQ